MPLLERVMSMAIVAHMAAREVGRAVAVGLPRLLAHRGNTPTSESAQHVAISSQMPTGTSWNGIAGTGGTAGAGGTAEINRNRTVVGVAAIR
jgi:hypothetical protein